MVAASPTSNSCHEAGRVNSDLELYTARQLPDKLACGHQLRGWGQTLFSGAQRQDKGQWAQTEA